MTRAGNVDVPAAVSGFGVVFTEVEVASHAPAVLRADVLFRHGRADALPGSTTLFRTGRFDLILALAGWTSPLQTGRILCDGLDVTGSLLGWLRPGTLVGGGVTFRCPRPRSLLSAGDHVLQVEVGFADGSRRRNGVRWVVVPNTEP